MGDLAMGSLSSAFPLLAAWRLEDPVGLLLLLATPLAGGWWARRRTVAFSRVAWLVAHRPSWRQRLSRWLRKGRSVSFVLLVLALARPQIGTEPVTVTTTGRDVVVALDCSSSMRARDLGPEQRRFDLARDVLARFIEARPDDRLALVSFARFARLVCPLTTDRDALLTLLARLELAELDSDLDGTAIGMALAASAEALENSPEEVRTAVLLTDGENNENAISPAEGAAWCRAAGVKVYIVFVGGRRGESPERAVAAADAAVRLETLAAATGGAFYRAEDAAALRAVCQEIDALERSRLEDRVVYASWFEAAGPCSIAALVLLLLDALVRWAVARRFP